MRLFHVNRTLSCCAAGLLLLGAAALPGSRLNSPEAAKSTACPSGDTGLTLPAGFCATIFAQGIGHARHLVVAQDGVVYVNTWSGAYYGRRPAHAGGFLVALQDKTGSGKADVIERFGETAQTGGAGGTGIGIYKNWLYAEINDRIVRYALTSGSIVPQSAPETVVSGLPLGGDHPMHPFIIDSAGSMYVDVATATNSCQVENRQPGSAGKNPCTELETRGGVWRYSATELNQKFSGAARYATGIRNAEGLAIGSDGIFVTQHGRDQLHANWPKLYKPSEEATLPAEELLLLKQGGDYGWPECYYDGIQQKLVLAPEYGGDGGKRVGICANKIAPVAAFPAHWAPNGLTIYNQQQFPARYHGGAFIAFHGSWDRAPYPQGGYNVVFQPLRDGKASGSCEVFASGFAGPSEDPGGALHRPSGVAVGPDGSMYVADDVRGTVYRIVYRGGAEAANAAGAPCPAASALGSGPVAHRAARPPEGTHANAGGVGAAGLPAPPGATRAMVVEGDRIYHGHLGGATCTSCHGQNGKGSPLGPDLTSKKYLWSDRSYAGIMKTIRQGVAHPKQYRSPMPPMGGAQLTPSELKAVSAYVWALSHSGS